jgi:hypothetical protein
LSAYFVFNFVLFLLPAPERLCVLPDTGADPDIQAAPPVEQSEASEPEVDMDFTKEAHLDDTAAAAAPAVPAVPVVDPAISAIEAEADAFPSRIRLLVELAEAAESNSPVKRIRMAAGSPQPEVPPARSSPRPVSSDSSDESPQAIMKEWFQEKGIRWIKTNALRGQSIDPRRILKEGPSHAKWSALWRQCEQWKKERKTLDD